MNSIKLTRSISGYSSIILDSLRISAALLVLVYHMFMYFLPTHDLTRNLAKGAHGGVVVFFVLSGYVIAYTTIQRNRGGRQYILARISRLYSIIVPTLAIMALIELILFFSDQSLSAIATRGAAIPRYALALLFSNEIWFLSAAPPINGPLWSLSYEFWYYIIFGLFFYRKSGGLWLLPGILASIIAGPKILLMMPIWLLGYISYKYSYMIARSASWFTCILFVLAAVISIFALPELPGKLGDAPLFFSGQFVTDIITGVFVALALATMPLGGVGVASLVKPIRKAADLTFPIYVLHFPLIFLYDSLSDKPLLYTYQLAIPTIAVLTGCILIGIVLERYRRTWDSAIQCCARYITNILKARGTVFQQHEQ